MKKNILILLLLACSFMGHAQVNRPKLVVGIVVDQMRWDYLYYYNKEFVEGGFKRLLAEHHDTLYSHGYSHWSFEYLHR